MKQFLLATLAIFLASAAAHTLLTLIVNYWSKPSASPRNGPSVPTRRIRRRRK